MTVVLIPAYKPDEQLIRLTRSLSENGLSMLVVDDGSGEDYAEVFARCIEQKPQQVKVYHSPENEGKGCALKHGMRVLREWYPDCTGFITADADGQHKVEDILKVREALENGSKMVLTIRSLKGKIPTTSRMGNWLSRIVYTIATGHYFPDNQSGLRGFTIEQSSWLVRVAGDKYDYELNLLYYADKQHIKIDTVPIETIYIDGNKSTHFDPLHDTLRIYRSLFASARASLISSALGMLVLIFLTVSVGYENCYMTIPGVTLLSIALCIVLENAIFKGYDYKDAPFVFWSRILRSVVYTGLSMLAMRYFDAFPMAALVAVAAIAMMALRYLFHRLFPKLR